MVGGAAGIAIAVAGALLLDRFRVPAGTMVGSLVGVLIALLVGFDVLTPGAYSIPAISIVVGLMLALRLNRHLVQELRALLVPALYVSVGMVGLGFGLGLLLIASWGWEPATASFSTYPGGLEQMVILAGAFGGNVYTVTSIQLFRWVLVVTAYPLLFRSLTLGHSSTPAKRRASPTTAWTWIDFVSVGAGVVGGVVAHVLGVPAGALLGSFMSAAVYRGFIAPQSLALNPFVSKLALALVGYIMGAGVSREALLNTRSLIGAAVIVTGLLILVSFVLGLLLYRVTGWSRALCIIATAPAGTLEMTLLSEQLGLNAEVVFALHFSRTLAVIVLAPILFELFW